MTGVAVPATGVWAPPFRRLTASLVLNVTLVGFESLAVATIVPTVTRRLGDLALYGWVFSAFFLASLLGIVAAGQVADSRGVRLPLAGGLALFATGLVIAGLAPDMPVLVGGRVVQGFGAGAVPAAAYVAIGRVYPQQSRPRMFAVLSSAWVVPGLVGPAVAAQVAVHLGWRWVFLGLVPLTIAAMAMALAATAMVPPPEAGVGAAAATMRRAAAVTAGAALLLVGLSTVGRPGLGLALGVVAAVAGVALLVPALGRLTPPRTLRAGPGLPAAVLARGLLTFAYFAGDAYVPLTLSTLRHTSTAYTGLVLTVATLTWTAGSWVQARLVVRSGPQVLIGSGLLVVLLGLAGLLTVLYSGTPVWVAMIAWAVGSFGIGLAYSPISLIALGWARPGQEGRASAALQLTDVLGTALGTGVAGASVAVLDRHSGQLRIGLAVAFGLAAGVAGLAVIISPRLPAQSSREGA